MIDEYLIKKAEEYQQKYNLGKNPGTRGHNDETDAFRHAFMQAYLSYKYTDPIAHGLATVHEWGAFKPKGYPDEVWKAEVNMDLWNNAVGREVGKYIMKNLDKVHNISEKEVMDWMAEKIYERLKKGDLITDPFKDKRDYKSSKYNGRIYTSEDILNMKGEEFNNHSKFIDEALNNKTVWSDEQVQQGIRSGELVFVNAYQRADGTPVRGYYRSV